MFVLIILISFIIIVLIILMILILILLILIILILFFPVNRALGEGAYGVVFLGKRKGASSSEKGKYVAIKVSKTVIYLIIFSF